MKRHRDTRYTELIDASIPAALLLLAETLEPEELALSIDKLLGYKLR